VDQHTHTPTGHDRKNTDKRGLSANRRRNVIENDEYAAFTRRIIRSYSRRVASGDIEALASMVTLASPGTGNTDRPAARRRGHWQRRSGTRPQIC
jgi:hypothetical protein